jgi:hypothetical protein
MCPDPDGDFFLCAAVEWAAVARTTTLFDPIIATLYRELAFCHLLFKRGKYAAVLTRLRIACGVKTRGNRQARPPDRAETLAVAADLLDSLRLRLAVAEQRASMCFS